MTYKLKISAVLLLLCAATFTGCSTQAHKAQSSREWIKVSCSGAAGWEACSRKALALCPHGYDIADKEENLVTGLRAYSIACKE